MKEYMLGLLERPLWVPGEAAQWKGHLRRAWQGGLEFPWGSKEEQNHPGQGAQPMCGPA